MIPSEIPAWVAWNLERGDWIARSRNGAVDIPFDGSARELSDDEVTALMLEWKNRRGK